MYGLFAVDLISDFQFLYMSLFFNRIWLLSFVVMQQMFALSKHEITPDFYWVSVYVVVFIYLFCFPFVVMLLF